MRRYLSLFYKVFLNLKKQIERRSKNRYNNKKLQKSDRKTDVRNAIHE